MLDEEVEVNREKWETEKGSFKWSDYINQDKKQYLQRILFTDHVILD